MKKENVLDFLIKLRLRECRKKEIQTLVETYLSRLLRLSERKDMDSLCEYLNLQSSSEMLEIWNDDFWDDICQDIEEDAEDSMTPDELYDCARFEYAIRLEEQLDDFAGRCAVCQYDRDLLVDSLIAEIESGEEYADGRDLYVWITVIPKSIGMYLSQTDNKCSILAGEGFVCGQNDDYIISQRDYGGDSAMKLFGVVVAAILLILSMDDDKEVLNDGYAGNIEEGAGLYI